MGNGDGLDGRHNMAEHGGERARRNLVDAYVVGGQIWTQVGRNPHHQALVPLVEDNGSCTGSRLELLHLQRDEGDPLAAKGESQGGSREGKEGDELKVF